MCLLPRELEEDSSHQLPFDPQCHGLEWPFEVSGPYDDLGFNYLLLVWSCTQCKVYTLKSIIVLES